MANKENVILGSGYLYIAEHKVEMGEDEIPADEVIETDDNQVGHISGGCELQYISEYTEVEDDMGVKVKSFLTKEDVVLKSGILSWNGKTLEKLCSTARVTEADGIRTVKIGGKANANNKSYIIRFVHDLGGDEGEIKVTIIGKSTNGFNIAFKANDPTVIDAEFTAQSAKDGTLVRYTEPIPVE